jgi:hypothetical protein
VIQFTAPITLAETDFLVTHGYLLAGMPIPVAGNDTPRFVAAC